MKYEFTIHEKAIGKARPRYSSKTGRMYTPETTRSFEEKVRWSFTAKYNVAAEPSERPFKAKITAVFAPAKSLSQKKKAELLNSLDYTGKPDVDNIAKIILDSLNGLVYKDDKQVTQLKACKSYGIESKIVIQLEEIE